MPHSHLPDHLQHYHIIVSQHPTHPPFFISHRRPTYGLITQKHLQAQTAHGGTPLARRPNYFDFTKDKIRNQIHETQLCHFQLNTTHFAVQSDSGYELSSGLNNDHFPFFTLYRPMPTSYSSKKPFALRPFQLHNSILYLSRLQGHLVHDYYTYYSLHSIPSVFHCSCCHRLDDWTTPVH